MHSVWMSRRTTVKLLQSLINMAEIFKHSNSFRLQHFTQSFQHSQEDPLDSAQITPIFHRNYLQNRKRSPLLYVRVSVTSWLLLY